MDNEIQHIYTPEEVNLLCYIKCINEVSRNLQGLYDEFLGLYTQYSNNGNLSKVTISINENIQLPYCMFQKNDEQIQVELNSYSVNNYPIQTGITITVKTSVHDMDLY